MADITPPAGFKLEAPEAPREVTPPAGFKLEGAAKSAKPDEVGAIPAALEKVVTWADKPRPDVLPFTHKQDLPAKPGLSDYFSTPKLVAGPIKALAQGAQTVGGGIDLARGKDGYYTSPDAANRITADIAGLAAGGENSLINAAVKGVPKAVGAVGRGVSDLAQSELADAESVLSKNYRPKVPVTQHEKDVALLESNGVNVTHGQRAGGVLKDTEDKATSVPLTGHAIVAQRKQGINDWNIATANKILEPIGVKVSSKTAGGELHKEMNSRIGGVYSAAYDKFKNVRAGQDVLKKIQDVIATRAKNVNDADKGLLKSTIDSDVTDLLFEKQTVRVPAQHDAYGFEIVPAAEREVFVPKVLNGPEIQDIRSQLRREIRAKSSNPSTDPHVASALRDVDTVLHDMLEGIDPKAAARIADADEAYAGLVRMEEAGAKNLEGGGFTPAQFLQTVRRLESGDRNKAFGNGRAFLQDWGAAAQRVLPSKVPDSGTAGRAAIPTAITLGINAPFNPLASIGAAGGLAAGALPYTNAGMRLGKNWAALERRPASEVITDSIYGNTKP